MRILLIDDDETSVKVRQHLLELSGYLVSFSLTGAGGIAACSNPAVDLALVDYQLPDMPGEKLIEGLRQARPGMPIILLSGQLLIPDSTTRIVDALVVKGEGARKLLETVAAYIAAIGK